MPVADGVGEWEVMVSAVQVVVADDDVLLREGVAPELDYSALGVFFRLGYFLGSDTPFRYIKALDPDTTLTWRARLRSGGACSRMRESRVPRQRCVE